MNEGNRNSNRTKLTPIIGVLAAGALLTACDPQPLDPTAADNAEIVNVDPYEAVPPSGAPEWPVPGDSPANTDPAFVANEPDRGSGSVDQLRLATAKIEPASGSTVGGTLEFRQDEGRVVISGVLEGLEPGEHGLHIHTTGNCSSPDAESAGGHFDPDDDKHGQPESSTELHHVGDLGNIVANDDGVATIEKTDSEMTLGTDENTIVSRAVIVHAMRDDLVSQPAGASGDRVACGVVTRDIGAAT